MSHTEVPAPSHSGARQTRLRSGAIGAGGIILMVVAAAAPLSAMVSNLTLSIAIGAGTGTLVLVLVVGAVFVLFTAGYVAMSRQVVSTGAFYEFITFGLGRAIGSGSAFTATILYSFGATAMAVITGFFAQIAISAIFGVDVVWWLLSAVAVVAVAVLGHLGVGIASKATSVTSFIQFAIVTAFIIAVIVQNPEGFGLARLQPAGGGLTGDFALSFIFIVLCFTGYEAAAIYGEEARSPYRTVKRATYGSLAVLVVVFGAATWGLLAAFDDPISVAQADPGMFVFTAIAVYLGEWAVPVLVVLIPFCFFAAAVSFSSMANRYLFTLGRAGLLPAALATVHPRRGTPSLANLVQTVIAAVLIALAAATGADPFLVITPAVAAVLGVSLLGLLAACSLSAVIAGRRGTLEGSIYAILIAPAISTVVWVASIVLFFVNLQTITGSTSLWISFACIVPLLGFGYGAITYMVRTRRFAGAEASGGPAVESVAATEAPHG